MLLSIIIPARNEVESLPKTVLQIYSLLIMQKIRHEIIVVNDNSTDGSAKALKTLKKRFPTLKVVNRTERPGFGLSVREGIETAQGEAIAVFMADGSDDVSDLVTFYQRLRASDVDCVFGTRFSRGGKTYDYPIAKYILNRVFNIVVSRLFRIPYDDLTNAFKMYRRSAIELTQPLVSHHFNLCIEIPLKAIIRGCSYEIVPNSWSNRKSGISKLKIKEMGSRYMYIVINCYLEKLLTRGDYSRSNKTHDVRTPPKRAARG